MSDARRRISDALKRRRGGLGKFHRKAACAQVAPELLAEQQLDIRLIIDHENEKVHARPPDLAMVAAPRGRTILNSVNSPGCGIDLYRPAMLLDDDVMAERKAEPGALTGRLGREERIEHLLLHLGRNAGAVVADPDFDAVAEVLGRGGKRRLIIAAVVLRLCAWSRHRSRWRSG